MKRSRLALSLILAITMILSTSYAAADKEATLKVTAERKAEYVTDDHDKRQVAEDLTEVRTLWKSLSGQDGLLVSDEDKDKDHLEVAITGELPEGVTAEAGYYRFDGSKVYESGEESALYALEIKLKDKDGNNYVPDKPVKLRLSGSGIKSAIDADDDMLLYSYEENEDREKSLEKASDKKADIYAADVLVLAGKGEKAADKVDADESKDDDALHYAYDKNGFAVKDKKAIEFEYKYGSSLDAKAKGEDAVVDAARFVLSMKKHQEEEKSEDDKSDDAKAADGQGADDTQPAPAAEDTKTEDKKDEEPAEDKKADVPVTGERTLTATDGKTYKVSVSYDSEAGIPDGTRLSVKQIKTGSNAYYGYVGDATEALDTSKDELKFAHVLDITLVDPKTGEHYQPDSNVNVSIELLNQKIAKDEDVGVVHFKEGVMKKLFGLGNGRPEVVDSDLEKSTVAFESDSFSVYVIAGFTVDFHWGDYTYHLNGEGDIYLSDLIRELRISEFKLDDVEEVSFSDESLLKVEKVSEKKGEYAEETDDETDESVLRQENKIVKGQDWHLKSLKPFDTEETLTIRLKDGTTYSMKVTDARFTVNGVTYTTSGNDARVVGITNGVTIPRTVFYGGTTYTVTDIALGGADLRRYKSTMDYNLVKAAAGKEIALPTINDTPPDVGEGFVPGTKNGTAGTKDYIWKKATYNETTQSLDYVIKYFRAMNKDVKLDFIFVFDDSVTMYTGTRWAPSDSTRNVHIRETQGTRIMIQEAAHALLTTDKSGYGNIRVALAGASSGDNRKSNWTQGYWTRSYDDVTNYLSTYNTGTTSHTIGVENALALARDSKSNGGTPVVIYLSDFKDGAYNTTEINQLHSVARVYALATTQDSIRRRAELIASDEDAIFSMNHISEGVQALEDIINDAVGLYINGELKVNDELSDAISDKTVEDLSSDATDEKGTARTPTAANGKITWDLGAASGSGGTRYVKAGELYTETFSVELKDDKVYSGSMPTNNDLTVTGKNGDELNSVPGGTPTLDAGVTFVLGMIKKEGGYDETTPFNGVKFTLSDGTTSKEYVTNGSKFPVPFEDFQFRPGETFTLTQDQATTPTGESADPRLIIANPMTWTLKVNADYTITATKAGADTDMTIKNSQFRIWNNEFKEPPLIKVFVHKNWEDVPDTPAGLKTPITFTVYGVKADGTKVALPAYNQENRATATQVTQLTSDGSYTYLDVTGQPHTINSTDSTWVREVWVPKYLVEDKDIKSYTIDETPLTNPGQSGDVLGVPGTWEDVVVTTGKTTEGIKTETTDWVEYSGSGTTKTYYLQFPIANQPSTTTTDKIISYFKVGNDSYKAETSSNNSFTYYVKNPTSNIFKVHPVVLPFVVSVNYITVDSLEINGITYHRSDMLNNSIVYNTSSTGTVVEISNPTTKVYKWTVVEKILPSDVPLLTLTNTFEPNNKLTLKSVFNDGTQDSASTNKITKIKYTLKDETGKEITTPAVEKGASGFPDMKIYVPDGNYTVYQTYYYLDGFGNVRSKTDSAGEFDAFGTTSLFKPDGANGETGGASVNNKQIDKNTTITFTNTRKSLPVTVKAEWLRPGDNPEPESGSDLYENGIPYEMSYKVYDGSVSAVAGNVKGATDPQWQNVHTGAGAPPSYSVDGSKTKLEVASTDINELLKDYDTVVTRDDSDSTKVVFTITNTLKRGIITVSKEWMLAFKETPPAFVKVQITGPDGIEVAELTLDDTNNWIASTEEIPVGKTYKVTETAIDRIDMNNNTTYTISYAQDIEVPNPDYDPQDPDSQKYIMVPKTKDTNLVDLTAGGAAVVVTNSKFICKIVETQGSAEAGNEQSIEYPFTSLNAALAFARTHMGGEATIEMLVDYAIPEEDQLDLDQSSDKITITTAATSGGDYNFVPTFTEADGRTEDDSPETAILRRKVTNSDSLFKVTGASATLSVSNIIVDGGSELETPLSTNKEGGLFRAERGILNVMDGAILRNSHAKNGGGIYVGMPSETTASLFMTGGEIINCVADAPGGGGTGNYDGWGGGICVRGGSATLNGNAKITSCKAGWNGNTGKFNNDGDGGGINVGNNGSLSIYGNVTIEGCSALFGSGINLEKNNNDTAFLSITEAGVSIKNCNSQKDGGGICIRGGNTFTLQDFTLNGNKGRNGGGIYTDRAHTLKNVRIESCTSSSNGGGINSSKALTLDNCVIKSNTANSNGGGVYVSSGSAILDHTTVESNTTSNQGGGVYVNCDLTLRNESVIQKNKTRKFIPEYGGGAYITNGKKLYIGYATAPSEGYTEKSRIVNNTQENKTFSNVRIPEKGNTAVNDVSVIVLSNLDTKCKISVANARQLLTNFGLSDLTEMQCLQYEPVEEGREYNLVSDDGTMYGVFDPVKARNPEGKKIIWMGTAVCKLAIEDKDTEGSTQDGIQLYFADGNPAVFTSVRNAFFTTTYSNALYTYNENSETSSKLDLYTGTHYYVKMLVSQFIMNESVDSDEHKNKTYTLTTAGDQKTEYALAPKEQAEGMAQSEYPDYYNYLKDPNAPAIAMLKRGDDITFSANLFTVKPGVVLTLTNITLDGNSDVQKNGDRGSIMQVRGPKDGLPGGILNITTGATIQNSWSEKNPGVFNIASGSEVYMDGGTIKNCKATNGGAFNIENGGKLYLSGGSIISNAVKNASGAIHISSGGKLYLSGNPDFGGTGVNEQGELNFGTTVTGSDGKQIYTGNNIYLGKQGNNDTNGGKLYPTVNFYGDVQKHPRSDIFIDGSGNPLESIIITDNLTSEKGSIWVWANNENHFLKEKQFAVLKETGLKGITAFRNARSDGRTAPGETLDKYLSGVKHIDDATHKNVYWGFPVNDQYKVILRKVRSSNNTNITPLAGAVFRVFNSQVDEIPGMETSKASGVFFVGELAAGKYYAVEMTAPEGYGNNQNKVFEYEVGDDGQVQLVNSSGTLDDDKYKDIKEKIYPTP